MLVSAIMPTRGRQQMAAEAVEMWRAQTYRPLELVIVDDIDARSFPQGIEGDGIRYHVLRTRLTIGEKRNIACSRASGDVICHWDSDDVSQPERIADQVEMLEQSGKQVAGYRSMQFVTADGQWWFYQSGNPLYALGTSLMYRRDWWMRNPFVPKDVHEDEKFADAARAAQEMASKDAGEMMHATIHPGNTSPRIFAGTAWRKIA